MPARPRCKAVETDDGWLINGTKNFVTNGAEAHVTVLFAVTNADDPSGIRCRRSSSRRARPGFTLGKLEKKLGIKASSTAELIFEDCLVPKEQPCWASPARA